MISLICNRISLYGSVILFLGIVLAICDIRTRDREYPKIMIIIGSILLIVPRILAMDTQLSTVQVKVIDQEKIVYQGRLLYPITSGGLIAVEYNGETYQLEGDGIYKKYKDKVGTYVTGTLKTTVYVDGSEHKEIVELQ